MLLRTTTHYYFCIITIVLPEQARRTMGSGVKKWQSQDERAFICFPLCIIPSNRREGIS